MILRPNSNSPSLIVCLVLLFLSAACSSDGTDGSTDGPGVLSDAGRLDDATTDAAKDDAATDGGNSMISQFQHVPLPSGAMSASWYQAATGNYTEGIDDPVDWSALFDATPVSQRFQVAPGDDIQAVLDGALPGDMILFKDGIYSELSLTLQRTGSPTNPIVLTALAKVQDAPGDVVFEGGSRVLILRAPAQHYLIGGFQFRGQGLESIRLVAGAVRGDAYESGPSDIRISDNWFENIGRQGGSRNGVVRVGDRSHRVRIDHNVLQGNYNHIRYRYQRDSRISATKDGRVDHNYFGPAPTSGFLDGVPYEIGALQTCCSRVDETSDPLTLVFEYNAVELTRSSNRVDPETLEIKTNGAMVRRNIFDLTGERQTGGSISLRSSNSSKVDSNYGYGLGIVVHGSNHEITNNYLNCDGQLRHGLKMSRWGRRAPPNCTSLPSTHDNLIDRNTILNPGDPNLTPYGMRFGDVDFFAARPMFNMTISNNVVIGASGTLGFFDETNRPSQSSANTSTDCNNYQSDDDLGGTNTDIVFTNNFFETKDSAIIGNIQELDSTGAPTSRNGLGSSLLP